MLTRYALALAVALIFSSSLSAQIADFTDHDNSHKYGTYNLSYDASSDLVAWPSHAESAEFSISVFMQVVAGDAWDAVNQRAGSDAQWDLSISYVMSVVNKRTGQKTTPTVLGDGTPLYIDLALSTFTAYTPSLDDRFVLGPGTFTAKLSDLRPRVAFTPNALDPGNPDTAVVTLSRRTVLDTIDVFAVFLEYNSAANSFIESLTRTSVNLSQTTGASFGSDVVVLDDASNSGDFVVIWRTVSTAGLVGGATATSPIPDDGNTCDVYARRFTQGNLPVGSGSGAGATAATDAVNVSASGDDDGLGTTMLADEIEAVLASDLGDNAWVAFVTSGEEAATVGGVGNGGPKNDASDVYVRRLNLSADLSLAATATNVSSSNGLTPLVDIAYNADLELLGVIFTDETEGGIGGNPALASQKNQPFPNPPNEVEDAFVRAFSVSGGVFNSVFTAVCTNVSSDFDDQVSVAIASAASDGFNLAWTSNLQAGGAWDTQYRSYTQTIEPDGDVVGAKDNYPALDPSSTVDPWEYVTDLTTVESNSAVDSVAISYMSQSDSEQENLRPGEQDLLGSPDVYLAQGEVDVASTFGSVVISSVVVNGGVPIDPNNAPASVSVEYVVANTGFAENFVISTSTISPLDPGGAFTLSGSISPDPTQSPTVAPTATKTFSATYTVNAAALVAGDHAFVCQAGGLSGTEEIGDTGAGNITVTGASGGISGIQAKIEFSLASGGAPTISAGVETDLEVKITVNNSFGADTITNLAFSGLIGTGYSPASLSLATFSPDPATASIGVGQVVVYTATITATSNVPIGDRYPTLTASMEQGTANGIVTAVPLVPISVVSASTEDQEQSVDPNEFFATQFNGGCALSQVTLEGSLFVLLLVFGGLFVVFRRRQQV